MRAMIAWWDLTESAHDAGSLRGFLREEAEQNWSKVPGLLLKFWISDPETNRWGAVLLWESEEAALAARPHLPRSAGELIGLPLEFRKWFDVEATVEGGHGLPSFSGLGPALGADEGGASEEETF
ncbi:hypothetical protein AB0B50_20900 [Streptomyces sp. NPDC041068]|uniref:hypothetical protein n=1 Tax=Streptomyces sp. NPDC041068 TaxID=3155130 RepID=UPI00340FA213